MRIIAVVIAFLVFWIAGCNKDPIPVPSPIINPDSVVNNPPPPPPPTGNAVLLNFEHVVGSNPLIADGQLRYQTAAGDSFSVELFKYYITNIVFTDDNGNEWAEPESYHLIDHADTNSMKVYVRDMPAGNYVSVRWMIGVDSARNVSGTQTGALDPSNAMFWSWQTGYIMAKLEGKSPASATVQNMIIFHVGGFAAPYATQRTVTQSFNAQQPIVTSTSVPKVDVTSNVLEWFTSPNNIQFNTLSVVTAPDADAMIIADNYADMFNVTGVTN
jgi:hypothetical protein